MRGSLLGVLFFSRGDPRNIHSESRLLMPVPKLGVVGAFETGLCMSHGGKGNKDAF